MAKKNYQRTRAYFQDLSGHLPVRQPGAEDHLSDQSALGAPGHKKHDLVITTPKPKRKAAAFSPSARSRSPGSAAIC